MTLPSRQDYSKSVNNLNKLVTAPHFRGGQPKRNSQGGLIAFSGGYSRVYPILNGGKTIALRCWIADIGKAKERYQKVYEYLKKNPLPYFVEFEFIEQGIIVNGQTYPILYMEWVNGVTLNKYLDKNIRNKNLILHLADEFQKMVMSLHQKEISHGDLQEGNILVSTGSDLAIKLIDYDSLYVPSLKGWSNEIWGYPAYQHPMRSQVKTINEKIDYFSELVIYLSLRAYAEKPNLWQKGQEQQLLFDEYDFIEPQKSKIFNELKTFSSDIRFLAETLQSFCEDGFDHLISLENVLSRNILPRAWDPFPGTQSVDGLQKLEEFFDKSPNPSAPPPSTNKRSADLDSFFGQTIQKPIQKSTPVSVTTPTSPKHPSQKPFALITPFSLLSGFLLGISFLFIGAIGADMIILLFQQWGDTNMTLSTHSALGTVFVLCLGIYGLTKHLFRSKVNFWFSVGAFTAWLFVGYYFLETLPIIKYSDGGTVTGIESLYFFGFKNQFINTLKIILQTYLN